MATASPQRSLSPTPWTRRLQVLTAACSLVFAIGTAIQNFLVVDGEMMRYTMQLAGMSESEAIESAPGFLRGFRAVGCLFLLGNALGVLALWGGTWVFWLVLVINAGQAAGLVMIPPEVFRASIDLYGPAGALPSVVTDGGALLLLLLLLASLVAFRAPWAQRRENRRPHTH